VSGVSFPDGHRLEPLRSDHRRRAFVCGQGAVDDWLKQSALQSQRKHLSTSKVLLDREGAIAGFYTLAIGLVDFGDLPPDALQQLPRRALPVAVLAWLGVARDRQGEGLGRLLLAQALCDCYEAGRTFAFVAIVLDCLDDEAKAFYSRWDFEEIPGNPYRLFLSSAHLALMVE
jgi:GNAT superfamily N-acetyltransferase